MDDVDTLRRHTLTHTTQACTGARAHKGQGRGEERGSHSDPYATNWHIHANMAWATWV